VKELLDNFVEISPPPKERKTTDGIVKPRDKNFSGFVFKIHSNLNPKHRDRIAFMRVCSGKFERNKFYFHVRLNRELKFANPTSFMANNKSVIDEAFPGDVVGLYDSGFFKIGDTLTEGEQFMFIGIPQFSPEVFRVVRNLDPFKTKQLEKGIQYLTDEGLAQLFSQKIGNKKVVGVVGELQFDVLKYRLLNEYGANVDFIHMNAFKAFWVSYSNKSDIDELQRLYSNYLYTDKNDQLVFIAESNHAINTVIENNPKIKFLSAIEHNDKTFSIESAA
jgi:peptide chain release factor 3